jgi:hypothetical protein
MFSESPEGREPVSAARDALVGRLSFYFTNRHSEPLARARARSIIAQLRTSGKGQA